MSSSSGALLPNAPPAAASSLAPALLGTASPIQWGLQAAPATSPVSSAALSGQPEHAAATAGSSLLASGLAAACLTAATAASGRRRRNRQRRTAAKAAAAGGQLSTSSGQGYVNLTGFPFPLGPIFERRTVRREVGDGIWTFEQEQSLANIAVNVRMTAIRLECGGLWVHNPVAPTEECMSLLRELDLPVRYIVLGSAQYEHKIFVGPFSRRFPEAKVYIVPQQWSWPFDLPSQLYGIFPTGELKDSDADAPWAQEIDQKLLCPTQRLGFGYSAAECAFFHRKSKTLICTDAMVFVPEEPPAVLDRKELTYLGQNRDNIVLDLVALTNWRGSGEVVREAQRSEDPSASSPPSDASLMRKGWQRDALLALYFGPDGKSIVDPTEAFNAISGRWIVGPVCYSLVYSGAIRQDVSDWAERMCEWDIQQIMPCHFAGPVPGSRDDVRRAFEVLKKQDEENEGQVTSDAPMRLPWPFSQPDPIKYRSQDIKLLSDLRGILKTLRVI